MTSSPLAGAGVLEPGLCAGYYAGRYTKMEVEGNANFMFTGPRTRADPRDGPRVARLKASSPLAGAEVLEPGSTVLAQAPARAKTPRST